MENSSIRVAQLLRYGLDTGILHEDDEIFARNLLLDALGLDSYEAPESQVEVPPLPEILEALMDDAAARGVLDPDSVVFRDLFDARLMNCLLPRPSEVRRRFAEFISVDVKKSTDWFYKFSQDSNYIRRDRVVRDRKWKTPSDYGEIDITINLSKPEKDPRAIAAALHVKHSDYPACQLCKEAEGYAGRVNYPGRLSHRLIPVTLNGEPWFFQYSPYTYYNEHAIVLSAEHRPMVVSHAGMQRLLDFVRQFPHYFVGSNADLPIVGGSILTHDHFQGGNYQFAMDQAPAEWSFSLQRFPNVEGAAIKWPMSVLRLRSNDPVELAAAGSHILEQWRSYSDPELDILAFSRATPHNTITPIARRDGEVYVLDLVLRNNRTTDERPLGIFHPRPAYHHIKKENIGLIEVMGLAVLPARLKDELESVAECLLDGSDPLDNPAAAAHAEWILELRARYTRFDPETIRTLLEAETGKVFVGVLEDAGVFKRDEAGQAGLRRFAEHCDQ